MEVVCTIDVAVAVTVAIKNGSVTVNWSCGRQGIAKTGSVSPAVPFNKNSEAHSGEGENI